MKRNIVKKENIQAINEEVATSFISTAQKAKAKQEVKKQVADIPAGYKLVREDIKTKRLNLILTQSNFDKIHRVINKMKQTDNKISINEFMNRYIESIKE